MTNADDNIKVCRRKSCKRFQIIVARTSRYCSACGTKLKHYYDDFGQNAPLVDEAPDPRSVTSAQMGMPLNSGAISITDAPPKRVLPDRQSWRSWGGAWNEYNLLLNLNGIATFVDSPIEFSRYNTWLEALGVGSMTDGNAIKALIARVKAHALEHHISLANYEGTKDALGLFDKVVMLRPDGTKRERKRQGSDVFTVECDDIKGCPIAPKCSVMMPNEMWNIFIYLAKLHTTEWLAYLKGNKVATNDGGFEWHITSFYFPKQTVTGAHVDIPDDFRHEEGTIGDIHSHNTMSAHFSKEDEDHFNWPLHIVINNRGDNAVSAAHTLGCGRTTRISGDIYLTANEAANAAAEALKTVMTEQTTTQTKGFYYS